MGAIDLAHATLANLGSDFVKPEASASREEHILLDARGL
jgi:hypothetical protein